MSCRWWLARSAFLASLVAGVAWAESAQDAIVLAPGYSSLEFSAPRPGTYDLPALWSAADGAVLDSRGDRHRLHDLMGDRAVILSFIYTSCNDVNGCPLATFVLSQLQAPIQADEQLRDRVRLLSLSFDPARDKSKIMERYGGQFRRKGFDWHFLTPASQRDLTSLLESYDQAIQPLGDDDASGSIAHVLRVFLIDESRVIRNIYSTSFLHADTVMSDLKTVLKPSD